MLSHCIPHSEGDILGDSRLGKLTAVAIKNAPPGKHEDGAGLRLVKRTDGGGQWVLRVTVHGRRREMGLGGFPSVSLKDARELATLSRLGCKGHRPNQTTG